MPHVVLDVEHMVAIGAAVEEELVLLKDAARLAGARVDPVDVGHLRAEHRIALMAGGVATNRDLTAFEHRHAVHGLVAEADELVVLEP